MEKHESKTFVSGRHPQATSAESGRRPSIDRWTFALLVALVVGAALRLWNLGGDGITHPEVYIPGIDLIPGLSGPPPRHGFMETLDWQFRSEGHPVGYYMAMWAWARLAGTDLIALRLPSVAMGVATVWLLWCLGRDIFDRRTAALAALLLALDGFHIFWSQAARVYVMGGLFAVLATWALVKWTRGGERRPWLEAGYAVALIGGTQTDELFWAVPFLHLAWAALVMPAPGGPAWPDIALGGADVSHRSGSGDGAGVGCARFRSCGHAS